MQVTVSLTVELGASAVDKAEELVLEAGRKAMKEALVQACREYERQQQAKGCPKCAGSVERLQSKGTRRRVVIATFGRTVLRLRRLRCKGCGHKFKPGAGFVQQLGGANITSRLRQECAIVGSSAPSYKAAAAQIQRLGGAKVNAETVRKYTNRAGAEQAEHKLHQSEQLHSRTAESVRAEATQPKSQAPQMLLVGLDGGWIASRDQPGGMEGKLGVIATQTEPVGIKGRRKLTNRLLVGTFGTSKRLGVLACTACEGLRGHQASKQSVLGDGAGWIKTEAGQHFGAAVKILDWGHLWRVVAKAVRAACPGQQYKRERKRLYECLRGQLWRGKVDEAIGILVGLRGCEKVSALEGAIEYLHNQRDWIGDYEQWKQQGYAVGSGLVERQVELVINRRLKRRGMRWLRTNAEAVLALRLHQLNADWHDTSAPLTLAA